MPKVNKENMKKALDAFENDDFLTAKDIIKSEIKSHVSDYYKEKLELTKDLNPPTTTDGGTE
jgi:hypothetical protein